jgi:hypothetical protein
MHDHSGRAGPARPPRRRWRPYLAALVAVLALALAVAACSSGGKGDGVASLGGGATSTTSPGGGDSIQADLAYVRCMRQHGINLPDPTPDGRVDLRGINPDDPRFKAAERACPGFRPKY